MLEELYVDNFRCFSDFTLRIKNIESQLIIGKNGTGKSSISKILSILQAVAGGSNRVEANLSIKDLRDITRKEFLVSITCKINSDRYKYSIEVELPDGFKEFRVRSEVLTKNEIAVMQRSYSNLEFFKKGKKVQFGIDWHVFALPIIQSDSPFEPTQIFRSWLSRIIILKPIPEYMNGLSTKPVYSPDMHVINFGGWFYNWISTKPEIYTDFQDCMKSVLPDFSSIENQLDARINSSPMA